MAKVQKPAELAAMEDSDGNAENVLISPKVGGQWTTLVSIFYPSAILCTSIGSSSRQSTALRHLRRDFSARTIRREGIQVPDGHVPEEVQGEGGGA